MRRVYSELHVALRQAGVDEKLADELARVERESPESDERQRLAAAIIHALIGIWAGKARAGLPLSAP